MPHCASSLQGLGWTRRGGEVTTSAGDAGIAFVQAGAAVAGQAAPWRTPAASAACAIRDRTRSSRLLRAASYARFSARSKPARRLIHGFEHHRNTQLEQRRAVVTICNPCASSAQIEPDKPRWQQFRKDVAAGILLEPTNDHRCDALRWPSVPRCRRDRTTTTSTVPLCVLATLALDQPDWQPRSTASPAFDRLSS